jgi:hypothetical protein
MNIFNKFNKLIPKQLYSTSKHSVLAIVFVLLVILVVQHPVAFRKSANTVFGKAIILLIIILLINYNMLVGLAATFVALMFYAHLFDSGYEGLVGDMSTTTTPKTSETSDKPEECSQTDIMLAAKCATAPQCSNAIPAMKVSNSNVQPAESTGSAKTTSDANTLKPAPATTTIPTN